MKKKIFTLAAPLLILFCQFCFWQQGYALNALYTISNPTTPVAAATICAGATKVPIHAFIITGSGGTCTGSSVTAYSYTTTGTYAAADIVNFKIWQNTSDNLGTATLLSTQATPTAAGIQGFPAFVLGIACTSRYFWITMDVAATVTDGNTIGVNGSASTANFASGATPKACTGCPLANSGTQTLKALPVITVQPVNQTCQLGTTVFSVTATGALTYQWQEYAGASWANITDGGIYSGATTAALTITGTTVSMNNYQYRCVISNPCAITSSAATLSLAYSSSTVTQNNLANIVPGTSNAEIIAISVVVASGCSLDATSFALNTTGSTAPGTDITAAKLWYTGTSPVFATTTLFGTQASPNGAFAITGTQNLPAAGTYYFWLTYDVPAGATVNDVADAQYTSLTAGGSNYTPSRTTVAGNRRIGSFLAGASPANTFAGGQDHSLAICTNGTVWSWAYNNYGQIGDNTVISKSIPVQTWTVNNIISVAAGNYHSLALKNDGTVWAWGDNANGKLGDGTTTGRLTPVQVSGLTGVVQVAASWYLSIALKSDGTVWTWGYNGEGQLGDGTTTTTGCWCKSTPVQVVGPGGSGFLTGITAVSAGPLFFVALKNDGTVWTWGWNADGQLGIGTAGAAAYSMYPVQVKGLGGSGFLTGITAIDAGSNFAVAIKNDGTVWSWGNNSLGQLGNGLAAVWTGVCWCISTPVQVVTGASGCGTNLCSIIDVSAGYEHVIALRNDGTVWAWGDNANGQLGDNTVVSTTAPVQVLGPGGVGFLTGITNVAAGWFHSFASKGDSTLWGWGGNNISQLGDNNAIWAQPTPVQTILCPVLPLPVEMLAFKTVCSSGKAKLQWSTASETNNNYFGIERSDDGVNFQTIGKVNGAGNSNTTRNYLFVDEQLPSPVGEGSGVRYYRLKQTDYNGSYTYSEVVSFNKNNCSMSVYPNPFDKTIYMSSGTGTVVNALFRIVNVLGQEVYARNIIIPGDGTSLSVDLPLLASGMYVVLVNDADNSSLLLNTKVVRVGVGE
ncbi:MAG: T9SS type A sorting domain-containing protein [Bacteroidetes bacterium]|nr:T9SS type A sorting domain-containing protein [Bacteroidota bacterium]